jgi:hypothetical protein
MRSRACSFLLIRLGRSTSLPQRSGDHQRLESAPAQLAVPFRPSAPANLDDHCPGPLLDLRGPSNGAELDLGISLCSLLPRVDPRPSLAQALARRQAWFRDPGKKLPAAGPVVDDYAVIFGYRCHTGALIVDEHPEDPESDAFRRSAYTLG